jgi:signal transduction histidine kinase
VVPFLNTRFRVKTMVKCWEVFECKEKACPVYKARDHLDLRCWLVPGTHCRNEIQGNFAEKIEMCLECEAFTANINMDSLEETLMVFAEQFTEFRRMVEERDRELEGTSMELAIGLSEVFEALKRISSGDPWVRIPETSHLELIGKLKHMVNLTAENLAEIVHLSHEFAIGLAEHFDVLHRVSKGDLAAQVKGSSEVELLELLKRVTNQTIESVAREIADRERAEEELLKARAELKRRVEDRTAELMRAYKHLMLEKEEHERAEKEARASEEKHRLLFNHDPNPLFVVELSRGAILDVNERAIEKYGYSRQEMRRMSLLSLFHEDDGTRFWKEVKASVKGPRTQSLGPSDTTVVEAPVGLYFFMPKALAIKKNGESFIVELHASAGKFGDAGELSLIVRAVDITGRLEQEAQLVQAGKMATLGEMATGIAHEINQPLSSIKLGADFFSKMISRGQKIPEEHLLKVGRNISQQVERATVIINHLRDFGRRTDFRLSPVDINEPIRGVFTLIGQQLRLREIEVDLILEEDLPPVLATKNQLEQIFLNLVTNARDAIEQKGERGQRKITITTARDGERVVAGVYDTGAGMSAPVKEKIFEPFFTTKEAGKGTGLGLSITYNLVKDFNGEIEVESEAGVGTAFRISLPIHVKMENEDEGDSGH